MSLTSIRARLPLLVLASTLPLLLFSAVQLARSYEAESALVRQMAMADVRRIGQAIDARLLEARFIVQAMAESPLLSPADPAAFDTASSAALAKAGIQGSVTLATVDGMAASHAPVIDRRGLARLFDEGEAHVSGLLTAGGPHLALHLPVRRGGALIYDAIVQLPADSIVAALSATTLPPGWFGVVADRSGHVIARTLEPEQSVGRMIAPSMRALTSTMAEGFAATTLQDDRPAYTGFLHSPVSGWLIGVAVPAPVVRTPLLHSALLFGAGALLLLAAGLALAWIAGRGIAGALDALAQEAGRLGTGEVSRTNGVHRVDEVEAVGRALQLAGQVLLARDAERDAALHRAEASEARLLLAQEVGEIGVWEIDRTTGRRTWSPQQFKLYGLDQASEPPHGERWLELIHPEDRARVLQTVAGQDGPPLRYRHEFRIVQPGGAVRWLRTAGVSQFRDGRPVHLIGVTLDTTDRHEAERDLRAGSARLEAEVAARTRELAESEDRFRTYFEYSADALLVVRVEPDGRFVYETMNKSGERLTGYGAHDLAGKTPEEALLPDTAAAVLETYRAVARDDKPLECAQTLAFPARQVELETVLVPVRDAGDRLVRIIVGHRDVTERRRIEGRLSHAQRLEAVGQLTGGVAHDFNNLLTVIIGNLALLRRRVGEDARALRYLASVETAAERGAKLTASLLAFSRRQTLAVAPLDVGALLQESTTLLRRALGEEIALTLDVAAGLPAARVDAAQLEAAVLNLAINARDAIGALAQAPGRRGGTLHIAVQAAVLLEADLDGNDEARPGRFIAIEVRDSGVGMTPEVRARAFEPFFTTKEIGQGTGLGLSQVFGFVRQLGGHVKLDSTPGHGTRVVLYLPEAAATPAPAPEAPSAPAVAPHAVVLVVEDDDGIRDVTAEMLRDAGLTVLSAPNGPLAMEVLDGPARIDLLFSDVAMPGGATGVELARAARTLRPGLPVLLTSGYGGPALSRYGAEGEFEVLAKPYTRAHLLNRIAHILAGAVAVG